MILAAWVAIRGFLGGFSLRVWLIAIAMASLAAWSVYLVHFGYSWADAAWQAKALEAQIAKLKLEIKTQKDADAAEDKYTAELEAETAKQKEVIDAYAKELGGRPDKCLLGDDAGKLQ